MLWKACKQNDGPIVFIHNLIAGSTIETIPLLVDVSQTKMVLKSVWKQFDKFTNWTGRLTGCLLMETLPLFGRGVASQDGYEIYLIAIWQVHKLDKQIDKFLAQREMWMSIWLWSALRVTALFAISHCDQATKCWVWHWQDRTWSIWQHLTCLVEDQDKVQGPWPCAGPLQQHASKGKTDASVQIPWGKDHWIWSSSHVLVVPIEQHLSMTD